MKKIPVFEKSNWNQFKISEELDNSFRFNVNLTENAIWEGTELFMTNVKFGEEEYLEKTIKIFEEVKKLNFEKYKCFILFLKTVFLCNFLNFHMKKQNIFHSFWQYLCQEECQEYLFLFI